MIKPIRLFAISFIFCSPALQAGTIIQIQNKNELSTVLTDGTQVRMNAGESEYIIIDYKSHRVKVVSPQKQEVMLLDTDGMAAGNNAPVVRTSINKIGAGGAIAGYKTQKFSYTANGKPCGIIYGSRDAYQVKGIKELFSAMKSMVEKQQAVLGGFAGMVDDCTLADMKLSDQVNTIGVPMRTVKNGRVETEIKSIKVNVTLPADTFVIPASYKAVTMQEQMNEVSKDMSTMQQQMQQYQPQMQQMMRQMQESGQLSPEALEQMRRAQEMMKQYQQP
jgi:hypothetical protein